MSDEIEKICKNCDNLSYGFGESSCTYGARCFEKDCSVDENDTCNMFELASYLKVKLYEEEITKLKKVIEIYKKAYELGDLYIQESPCDPDIYESQAIAWYEYQKAQKAVEELLK